MTGTLRSLGFCLFLSFTCFVCSFSVIQGRLRGPETTHIPCCHTVPFISKASTEEPASHQIPLKQNPQRVLFHPNKNCSQKTYWQRECHNKFLIGSMKGGGQNKDREVTHQPLLLLYLWQLKRSFGNKEESSNLRIRQNCSRLYHC